MSNPFGGPQPAIIPFSFTTDANGNATIKIRPRAAFWWSGKAVGKLSSGTAVWEANVGGLPVGFGRGQRAEIAGLMVAPGDTVEIDVISGPANVSGTGNLVGVQAATMQEVAFGFNSAPNTIALDVSQQPKVVGSFSGGNNNLITQTFPVPPGTVAIGVAANFNAPGSNSTLAHKILLFGHQSGNQYKIVYNPQFSIYTSLWDPDRDSSLDAMIDMTGFAGPSGVYDFLAFPFVPGNVGPGVEQGTQPFAGANTPPPNGQLVTLNGTTPAPWQAPNRLPIRFIANAAAGGTAVILSAPGVGLSLYIFDIIWFSTVASGAFGYIGDDQGNTYVEWAQTNPPLGPFHFNGGGFKMPSNSALVVANQSGVAMNNLNGGTCSSLAA